MRELPEILDRVDKVEHRLHRSFPNPIRLVEDKDSRFALKSAEWGEFRICVTVYLRDGAEEESHYDLDLSKSWPEAGAT